MLLSELTAFRLVGGTSLALQIGHRSSVDIDLFTDKEFDSREIQFVLAENFSSFQLVWQSRNGFSAQIGKVKTDIFNWRVPFSQPPLMVDSLRLMDKLEIGAMKLETITSRKDRKDYTDIFFLLQIFSLPDLIAAFRTKYPYMDYKFVLESLNAIDLADESEEPKILLPFDWYKSKTVITSHVEEYLMELKRGVERLHEQRIQKAQEMLNKKKQS